ncbi:MAG: hypothetical protein E6G92_09490 [Alphaproteobacteria bacterium]|nr:MAG: hypothetical protein E6G92_09490 [Alphaproteobacteria bacterium]
MAAFVAAVEGGALIADAARAAGVALSTLYYRRDRDPAFAAAWAEAVVKSGGPVLVLGQCGRRYQKQRSRRMRFTRERKQAFLDHFAGSCNLAAAAEAAGVSVDSVYDHLMNDPAFAQGFEAALQTGYRLLEAETLQQQRAAQEAYRIRPKSGAGFAQSFERSLQLLREYKSGGADGRIGRRAPKRVRERWTFEEAMAALEKKLTAFERNERRRGKAAAEEGPAARGPTPGPSLKEGRGECGESGAEGAPPPACGWSPSPGNPGEDLR